MRRLQARGIIIYLLLSALLVSTTAFADFSGPVVSVLDGDTRVRCIDRTN